MELRSNLFIQVTIEYNLDGGACLPVRVHTVVMSTQHSPAVTLEQLREDLEHKVSYSLLNRDLIIPFR